MRTWSAPVRYGETDQQGVVFNAHYLLYCDEAMTAYCRTRGIVEFFEFVRLKTSALTWHAAATWGDTIDVDVACTRIGRTSVNFTFELAVGERRCCTVETTYVNADREGVPQPVPDEVRAALNG